MSTPAPDNMPAEQRFKEFEDHHYHDDIEVVPPDDTDGKPRPPPRPPAQRYNKFVKARRHREQD